MIGNYLFFYFYLIESRAILFMIYISGFMIVTAFLSMFISNTATVAMMIPIVDAVCNALYKNQKMDHKKRDMLLLSVAYSANIGGTGFITGSPPNLLVLTQLKDSSVTFLTWVFFCVPLVICNLIVAFLWLQIFSYIVNKWNWLSPDPQRVQWYDQNRQMKIENHVETNEMINQHSSEMRGLCLIIKKMKKNYIHGFSYSITMANFQA